jgi:hypothetical protein
MKKYLLLGCLTLTMSMFLNCKREVENSKNVINSNEYYLKGKNASKSAKFPDPWLSDSYFNEISYPELKQNYNKTKSVNFARNYIVLETHCGTGCVSAYMVDVRDGKVYELPKLSQWEGNGNRGIKYNSNYNLLISHQEISNSETNELSVSTASWKWNENNKEFESVYPQLVEPWFDKDE